MPQLARSRASVAAFVAVLLPLAAKGLPPSGLESPAEPPPTLDLLADGFETGSTCRWSAAVPADAPPGVDCGLASFEPPLSFVHEGDAAMATIPESLTARIFRPAAAPTFVSVVSADPTALGVEGGGVTIAQGTTAGVVLLDGLMQHAGVGLTATLASVQLQATVRVVNDSETRVPVAIVPEAATIAPGGSATFDVELDIPAPTGGTLVLLAAAPGLGTLPESLTVLQDQLRASFTYVAGGSAGEDLLSATASATSVFATVTITP